LYIKTGKLVYKNKERKLSTNNTKHIGQNKLQATRPHRTQPKKDSTYKYKKIVLLPIKNVHSHPN